MDTHDDPVDAHATIDRLREVFAVQTDIALCAALGLGTSAVSTWRRRNSVPYAKCVKVALRHGVSLDWLLLGEGPRERGAPLTGVIEQPAAQDPRVTRMVRFIQAWPVGRDRDDVAWLERTLARNVQEYGQWLASQPTSPSRSQADPPDEPGV